MDAVQARALSGLGLKTAQLHAAVASALCLGRVSVVERGAVGLIVLDPQQQLQTARARLGYEPEVAEPIAVGDWVLFEDSPDPLVVEVLPRVSSLRRGKVGQRGAAQLIAANLDTVFVVAAFATTQKLLRRGLQARRLERFIAAVCDGGATPVVLLNKVDLVAADNETASAVAQELSRRLHRTQVLCTSVRSGEGLEQLAPYLVPGQTVAFIGLSGVGKSSLVNALLGQATQAVGEVRELDSKGRHTTTRRELIALQGGAWLIDTPGVREFALALDDDVAGFDDIEQLARKCRYGDCQHAAEPGCAVQAAVAAGGLAVDRVDHHRALLQDAKRARDRHDAFARYEQRRKGKVFGRMVRQAKALKPR